ncbi:MAG: hypothetical protein JJ862_17685 [Roseivirga sp.]|uniref:hypothetical protein n=1 Tax=Roseivirga sp. TaxID=1964215 RepID=UPI001B0833BF|nr:hypothetical protein [Roseivirga sp.]MBO6662139.1 hypothetical protein [Roseivirga sp.]MBO6910133.1 hypothetical protein [Roseivirga sp.]
MKKVFIVFTVLTFSVTVLLAQDEKPFQKKGAVAMRYMSTNNKGELTDFNAFVGYGSYKASYKLKPWLSFSGQVNGVILPSTENLEKRDAITGRGPIYEANLFNLRTMSAHSEFALPVLNAEFNHNGQILTVGRFVKNAQALKAEQWPFPNALEGIWYENYKAENASWQLAIIHKSMPRFSGDFEKIGRSLGVAGVGFNKDGSPSGYRNNIASDFLLVANYNRLFSGGLSLDIWNYMAEGVMNTFLVEPRLQLSESRLSIAAKVMYQERLGSGGNSDQSRTYKVDQSALYFGLRLEKQWKDNSMQLNVSRISDAGRFLMPREWGYEPFYTFQRRTRIEGVRDAISLMFKWQNAWSDEQMSYQFTSSIAYNRLPKPSDVESNKYKLPSHIHWDAILKVKPIKNLSSLSLETLVAYRFLSDNSISDSSVIINNADFFHTDLSLVYSF